MFTEIGLLTYGLPVWAALKFGARSKMERIQVFLRLSIVLGNPAGVPSSLKNEKKSSEVFRRVPKSAFVPCFSCLRRVINRGRASIGSRFSVSDRVFAIAGIYQREHLVASIASVWLWMGTELSTGRRCWARPDLIFQAQTRIVIYQPVRARFKPAITKTSLLIM